MILLARVVGLSPAEIGERMGRSEGAVRTLLFRASAPHVERAVTSDRVLETLAESFVLGVP